MRGDKLLQVPYATSEQTTAGILYASFTRSFRIDRLLSIYFKTWIHFTMAGAQGARTSDTSGILQPKHVVTESSQRLVREIRANIWSDSGVT